MLTDADLRALKVAYGALVDDVGGVHAAAALLRYGASHLSEAASITNADRWPRIDHVARLESRAGRPRVAEQLARIRGFGLREVAASEACVHRALALLVGEIGETLRLHAEAL